jgi:hypothetical protein
MNQQLISGVAARQNEIINNNKNHHHKKYAPQKIQNWMVYRYYRSNDEYAMHCQMDNE